MRRILFALVVLIILGVATWSGLNGLDFNKNKSGETPTTNQTQVENIIGGEQDEHGCLGPAGYSWVEDLKVCARTWEIKEFSPVVIEMAREKLVKLNNLKDQTTITIIETKTGDCEKCGNVLFEIGEDQKRSEIKVSNEDFILKDSTSTDQKPVLE